MTKITIFGLRKNFLQATSAYLLGEILTGVVEDVRLPEERTLIDEQISYTRIGCSKLFKEQLF